MAQLQLCIGIKEQDPASLTEAQSRFLNLTEQMADREVSKWEILETALDCLELKE